MPRTATNSRPAACTTSAAVRHNAVDPALEIFSSAHEARRTIARIHRDLTALAGIVAHNEACARQLAGFLEPIENNLALAERTGVPLAEVRDITNRKDVGRRAALALDCLAQPARDGEHQAARAALHDIFATFGAEVFEGAIYERVGKRRLERLTAEHAAWAR